jgi:hypothetical protein
MQSMINSCSQVATLENRNIQLAEEVTWLKHQLNGRPEVSRHVFTTSSL